MGNGIYELTLRAPDGRERRTLAWFPTAAVQQDFYDKARKRGLEIVRNCSDCTFFDNELHELNKLLLTLQLESYNKQF